MYIVDTLSLLPFGSDDIPYLIMYIVDTFSLLTFGPDDIPYLIMYIMDIAEEWREKEEEKDTII